jgi:diguanylate cyclase (GGDEF)-like protein
MRLAWTRRPERSTLRDVVHRAHLGMALVSVALAGTLLLLAGGAALRVYLENNLQLVARSLAYTVEAAVVFRDPAEAQSALERMVRGEGVANAVVLDAQGVVFARWRKEPTLVAIRLGEGLASILKLEPAMALIQHEGQEVGRVQLQSDGQGLLRFLGTGLAALALCITISGGVGMVMSRRMLRDIVTPLQNLAEVARAVHRDRALGQRVPPARIAELRELGDDFNALMSELEARQAHLQQQNTALAHRAQHDGLTGLSNRAHFEQCLQACIDDAVAKASQLAVLFLDNDHFKQINDKHGHAAGDALLVAVGERMRAQVRDSDLVARLGGDEFAVLLAPVRGADDALRIAEKIIQAMQPPVVWGDGTILQPSVSIGIAVYPEHGQTLDGLLGVADAAMYQAKSRRRGSHQMAHVA